MNKIAGKIDRNKFYSKLKNKITNQNNEIEKDESKPNTKKHPGAVLPTVSLQTGPSICNTIA